MPDHEEVSSDDCPGVSGVAAAPGNQGSASRPAESDPLRRLLSEFSALREYAAHLAATYVDLTRARARKLVISAILGIAAAIVGLTVAIACAIYTVRGVAGGLAAAVGGRIWLGELLAGVAGLCVLAGLAGIAVRMSAKRRHASAVQKYEDRKAGQRARIGRDVEEAACASV